MVTSTQLVLYVVCTKLKVILDMKLCVFDALGVTIKYWKYNSELAIFWF